MGRGGVVTRTISDSFLLVSVFKNLILWVSVASYIFVGKHWAVLCSVVNSPCWLMGESCSAGNQGRGVGGGGSEGVVGEAVVPAGGPCTLYYWSASVPSGEVVGVNCLLHSQSEIAHLINFHNGICFENFIQCILMISMSLFQPFANLFPLP